MQSSFGVIKAFGPYFQILGPISKLRRCKKIAAMKIGLRSIQESERRRCYNDKVSLTFYIVAINSFSMEYE
jgi:hypothetical protein